MRLNKRALAFAFGILWGVGVFLATIYVLLRGGGHTLVLLQQFYWGYNISWGGAFISFIYCFVYGFFLGRNRMVILLISSYFSLTIINVLPWSKISSLG